MRPRPALFLIAVLAAPLHAGESQQIYDSAGVRVYGYRLTAPRPAFVVSDSPVVSFHGRTRQPGSFGVLGATSMLRLSNGTIAVAVSYTTGTMPIRIVDGPPPPPPVRDTTLPPPRPRPFTSDDQRTVRELRIFDASGTLLRSMIERDTTIGGPGFSSQTNVLREPKPGLILAGNSSSSGWSVFDVESGEMVHRAALPARVGRPYGVVADGRVITGFLAPDAGMTPMVVNGYRVHLDSIRVRAASLAGDTLSWMKWAARNRRFSAPTPEMRAGGTVLSRAVISFWPVSAEPVVAGANRIWSFDVVSWELRMSDESGTIRAVVRPPIPERVAKATFGGVIPRDSVYALPMLVDDRGRLWFDSGENEVPFINDFSVRQWFVFGADGALLGSVAMPPGFRPMHVLGNEILGLWRPSAFAGWSAAVYRVTPVAGRRNF